MTNGKIRARLWVSYIMSASRLDKTIELQKLIKDNSKMDKVAEKSVMAIFLNFQKILLGI